MPSIIEFIGPPGSGKTALLPAVQAYCQSQDLSAYSVLDAARPFARRSLMGSLATQFSPPVLHEKILWQIFYYRSWMGRFQFTRKHPRLIRRVLASQSTRPNRQKRREIGILHWFWDLVGSYHFLTAHLHPEEVLLFDEGFVHRVVQLFASPQEQPDPHKIQAYLALVPQPDLVIHVQAHPATCEARIIQRGVWDFYRDISSPELSDFIHHAAAAVREAVKALQNQGWAVVSIDNNGNNLSETKRRLRQALAEYHFDQAETVKNPSLKLPDTETLSAEKGTLSWKKHP